MNKPLLQSSDKLVRTLFAQGNEALRTSDYREAITYYAQVLGQQSELPKHLFTNLAIARRKYRLNRQAVEKSNVGVCGWDLAHNAAGRVYTLAALYETFANVEIIGSIFPVHGRDIWEPIQNTSINKHFFIAEDESKFIEQAIQLVAEHPYDVVHLSKPRIPNIFFGILYKIIWDAKVLIDIDDEELTFVDAETSLSIDSYITKYGKLPELKNLFGKDWTQLAVSCTHVFDGCTVANHALQQRYGGQIVSHARNEKHIKHSSKLKKASRARLGIAPDAKVVLFLGTPRSHKGLVETAQAIASLKRRDVVFAIIGDFPDDGLKTKLQDIKGVNYIFVGNQPITKVSKLSSIGDVCVLLQDSQSSVVRYQTPAKLSDALASELPVLATETPALADAFITGALLPINRVNLAEQLIKVLDDEDTAEKVAQNGADFFRRELSFAANAPRLSQVVQKSEKRALNTEVDALGNYIHNGIFPAYRRFFKARTKTFSEPLTHSAPIAEQKIAIAVHVYYPELWPDISNRLQGLPVHFDLFVTATEENAGAVVSSVQREYPNAHIDIHPNQGMDIVPFLRLLPTFIKKGYLAVCKLHTKKGENEKGDLWRNAMLDALVGDISTFNQTIAAFLKEPSLQMVGPASLYMSAQKLMLDNNFALEKLFQQLENRPLPNVDWGFFSGTMFWVRPDLLKKLAQYVIQEIDEFETHYKKNGQFVHAIESIFGLLPALQQGQIGLLHPSRSEHSTHTLQLTSAYTKPSQAWVSGLMAQFANLDQDYTLLEKSGLFNSEYYRQQCPTLTNTDIDLVRHYLLIGRFQEKSPNQDFDPVFYLECHKEKLKDDEDPFLHYLRKGAREGFLLRPTKEQEDLEIPNFRYRALNTALIDWDVLAKKNRDSERVSIIIPVFNNPEITSDCIVSIYTHTPTDRFELIVVDNGSNILTKNLLDQLARRYDNLNVLHNEENLNFALGCNLGFAASRCEKVIFLNNDTTVTPNWLEPLIVPLNRSEISTVQPLLLFPDGTIQCAGVVFSNKNPLGYPLYAGHQPDRRILKKDRLLQAASAACIVVRAVDFCSCFGFDPVFINGQEDIDLCLRLNKNGRRTCVANSSKVIHLESKSHLRFNYVPLNRKTFCDRWKGKVNQDDMVIYEEDRYSLIKYEPDASLQSNQPPIYRPVLDEKRDILKLEPVETGVVDQVSEEVLSCPMDESLRVELSSFVDIDEYVRASTDLMALSENGGFDALGHLITNGFNEIFQGKRKLRNRTTYRGEERYLFQYPQVSQLVSQGRVSCGLEHYVRFGLPKSTQVLKNMFKKMGLTFSLSVVSFGTQPQQKGLERVLGSNQLKVIELGDLLDGKASLIPGSWVALVQEGVVLDPDGFYTMVTNSINDHLPQTIFGGVILSSGVTWNPGKVSRFDIEAAANWPAVIITKDNEKVFYSALSTFQVNDNPRDRLKYFVKMLLEQNFRLTAFCDKPLSGFATSKDEQSFYNKTQIVSKVEEENGEIDHEPTVSIIVPFCDKLELLRCCVNSILSRTTYQNYEILLVDNNSVEVNTSNYLENVKQLSDKIRILSYPNPFNFSAINNFAAENSDAEILVLLNNDTEIFSGDWLHKLAIPALTADVGAVGAVLTYEADEIQHAGVAIGMNGLVGHSYAGQPLSDLKFNWKFTVTHPVEAVTGACLAIDRRKYQQVGGLDEANLKVALNDIDLCLRLTEQGMTNLLVPDLSIRHYESKSRGWDCYDKTGRFAEEVNFFRERHNATLKRGDRFIDLNCEQSLRNQSGDVQGRVILILAIRLLMGYGVDLVIHNQAARLLRKGAKVIVGVHKYDCEYYGDVPYQVVEFNNLDKEILVDDVTCIVESDNVDMVIAHTSPFFEILPSLNDKVKTIAYEHGDPSPELFPKDQIERQNIKGWKVANVYPKVDKVIAISHFISEDINWPQADIIYNGIDHLCTTIEEQTFQNFKKRFKLNEPQKKVFLCVARLGKGERYYKGLDDFIVFKRAYELDDAVFVVAGRGTEKDASDLKKLGFQVILNATEADLRCAYKACDAFFSFSKWEGFNLPLVEAQCFGKPAFAINRCSHKEVTRNVFFSVDEVADFIRGKTKKELAILGAKNSSYIKKFTWSKNGRLLAKTLYGMTGQLQPAKPIVKERTSICIVTKNKFEYIKPCVESLLPLKKLYDVEILIGDTGTDDEEVLKYYEDVSGEVQIFYYNFYNFSKINNYLADQASGDVLIFLNNDTLANDSNWLAVIRGILSGTSVGVVGPMLLYGDGTIQHAGVEIFLDEPYRYVGWHPYAKRRPDDRVPVVEDYVVPAVTGACLAIKTKLFRDVGGFEEAYREECQDVDLCLKVRMQGKQVIYTGETSLYHYENGTRQISESPQDRQEFRNRWSEKIELLCLRNYKQRFKYVKTIKIEWSSGDVDALSRFLDTYNEWDVTVVVNDEKETTLELFSIVTNVRIINKFYPDNYVYDLSLTI